MLVALYPLKCLNPSLVLNVMRNTTISFGKFILLLMSLNNKCSLFGGTEVVVALQNEDDIDIEE